MVNDELKEGRKGKWKDRKKGEGRDRVLLGSIIPLPLEPGMLLSLGPGTTLPVVGEAIAGNRLVGLCSVKSSSLSTESTSTTPRVSSEGFSGPSCTMLLELLELTGATLDRGLGW